MKQFKVFLFAAATLFANVTFALAEPILASRTALISAQGYAYGFPILLMDETFKGATGKDRVCGFGGDVNRFTHLFGRPDPDFRAVVRPNVDTLYSSAFLDLKHGPMLLDMPAVKGRYVLMALLDAWSNNFAGLGTPSHGQRSGKYLIAGPKWSGKMPSGYKRINAPTDLVWIIGRTEVRGDDDIPVVNAIQKAYQLTPLRGGLPPRSKVGCVPANQKQAPEAIVKGLKATEFFARLSALIEKYPPPQTDADMLEKLLLIGVGPKASFDVRNMRARNIKALRRGAQNAQRALDKGLKLSGAFSVWSPNPTRVPLGDYKQQYAVRAAVAQIGFGANKSEYAVYQNATQDQQKQKLNGSKIYKITFEAGALPPVDAFWSLTVYDGEGYLTPNAINRYGVGSNSGLEANSDGSVSIFLSHKKPKDVLDTNWLPTPNGTFELTLRMYAPRAEILNGSWNAPPIVENKRPFRGN